MCIRDREHRELVSELWRGHGYRLSAHKCLVMDAGECLLTGSYRRRASGWWLSCLRYEERSQGQHDDGGLEAATCLIGQWPPASRAMARGWRGISEECVVRRVVHSHLSSPLVTVIGSAVWLVPVSYTHLTLP